MSDKRDWFRFVTNKATPKAAEIYIYGDIGETFFGKGVSAQAFVDELNELSADKLDVRINSLGGSAWDGMTIANALIRHDAAVTTWIDGVAASAASIVAVAGDEVVVSKYGQAMLHNARAMVMGTAVDLREVAQQLESLNANMAQYYADRAGGEVRDWVKAMNKETWYSADEMLAAGLATRIDESGVREEVEQAVAHAFASSREAIKYPGRKAAPAPFAREDSTKAAGRGGNPTQEGNVHISEKVAERLGLGADASDEEVLAKLDELASTDDKADDDKANDKSDAAPKVSELAEAAAKAGLTIADPAELERLREQATLGAQARAEQIEQAHARVIDDAIASGKITAPRRDHYLALMRADAQGTTDLLASIPPETAVPLTELGHSLEPQAKADGNLDDPKFKEWSF